MEEKHFEMDLNDRIRAGQSRPFETLMRPYSQRLLEVARFALRNDADADDVVERSKP